MKKLISGIISTFVSLIFRFLYLSFKLSKKYFKLLERQKAKFLKDYPLMVPVVETLDESYISTSPYVISSQELKNKGLTAHEELTYGETLIGSIPNIINGVKITEKDVFYELGSGTGLMSFFVNQYTHAKKIIGIDIIPGFIKTAKDIVKKFDLKNIYFYECDYLQKNMGDGTIFFTTLTCCSDEDIAQLLEKLDTLPNGIILITVTRPIISPKYKLIKAKIELFSWTYDRVYYFEKVD